MSSLAVLVFATTLLTAAPSLEHRSILEDLTQLHEPLLEYDFASSYSPPVSYEYHGLQAVAYRRFRGLYRGWFSASLKNCDIFEADRRISRLGDAEADLEAGGAWWKRPWFERYGPSTSINTVGIGNEIELLRFDEITFTTEGHIRARRLSLALDEEDPRPISDVPDSSWTVVFRQNMQVRVPKAETLWYSWIGAASGEIDVRFFDRSRGPPRQWGVLAVRGRIAPPEEVSITAEFVVLCW